VSDFADIHGMSKEDWRQRLKQALEAKGLSKRSVSLAAGLNPGYVHSVLVEGKDPTVDNLIAVCKAVGVSLTHVLFGLDVDPDAEEIVKELARATPERRRGLLLFLRENSA
jgi:transcriptional regulator with XRE-family HTH domain